MCLHRRNEKYWNYTSWSMLICLLLINSFSLVYAQGNEDISLLITKIEQYDDAQNRMVDITPTYSKEGQISLPHKNSLANIYIELSNNNKQKNQYAYRIKGIQNEWVHFREGHLEINQLPYGVHQLEITANTTNAIIAKNNLLIPILSKKPFYLQLPFIGASILLCLSCFFFYRERLKKNFLAEQKQLEQKIEDVVYKLKEAEGSTRAHQAPALKEKITRSPSLDMPSPSPEEVYASEKNNPTVHAAPADNSNSEASLNPKQKEWLTNLEKLILDNLDNNQFNTEYIASLVGLSRRQLQRKIKELAQLSPKDYIREIRMKEAQRLLKEGTCSSVKEVAEKIGLTNSTYFSELYEARFDKIPKEYF